jgi:GTP-binding protein
VKPIIAIVGRPNVGKSTFFNRLSKHKKAIVIDEPGATRDRNYADCEWNSRIFTLVDTGGFEPVSMDRMLIQMREQTTLAIEGADVIIFLMDGREGLTPSDKEIVGILRKTLKPVYYAINKMDSPKQFPDAYDFYQLGIDHVYTLSAEHGLGVGDLMYDIIEHLPSSPPVDDEDARIRIAVIGKPNVGKSSLINKLLGYERTIVNPTPGTTRDAIDTPFEINGRNYLLIDTAGIRRKSKVSLQLEKYSVMEAIRTLDRCDVALILIDASEGITDQDTKIAGLAYERGVACIVVMNKWDLLEKDNSTIGVHVKKIKDKLKYLDFAPIISLSALTGQRIFRIFELIEKAYEQYTTRISTGELNRKVREFIQSFPPPRYGNKPNPVSYVTQTSVKPPTFVFFVREPKGVHFSYERYLANRIREEFPFDMVPIRLLFRKKGKDT